MKWRRKSKGEVEEGGKERKRRGRKKKRLHSFPASAVFNKVGPLKLIKYLSVLILPGHMTQISRPA